MVLKYTKKTNFMLLDGFARVCTVSANFPDKPRISVSSYTFCTTWQSKHEHFIKQNEHKTYAVYMVACGIIMPTNTVTPCKNLNTSKLYEKLHKVLITSRSACITSWRSVHRLAWFLVSSDIIRRTDIRYGLTNFSTQRNDGFNWRLRCGGNDISVIIWNFGYTTSLRRQRRVLDLVQMTSPCRIMFKLRNRSCLCANSSGHPVRFRALAVISHSDKLSGLESAQNTRYTVCYVKLFVLNVLFQEWFN